MINESNDFRRIEFTKNVVKTTPWNSLDASLGRNNILPDSIRSAKTVTRAHFSMDSVPEEIARDLCSLSYVQFFFSNSINESNAFRRIDFTKNVVKTIPGVLTPWNSFSRYVWAETIFCRIQFVPPMDK